MESCKELEPLRLPSLLSDVQHAGFPRMFLRGAVFMVGFALRCRGSLQISVRVCPQMPESESFLMVLLTTPPFLFLGAWLVFTRACKGEEPHKRVSCDKARSRQLRGLFGSRTPAPDCGRPLSRLHGVTSRGLAASGRLWSLPRLDTLPRVCGQRLGRQRRCRHLLWW